MKPPLIYVDHVEHSGVDLFNGACEKDLEGIVAKLASGGYDPKATTWVKIENRSYSQAEGRAEFFDPGHARRALPGTNSSRELDLGDFTSPIIQQ